jgi:hypothetical protein
MTSLPTLSPSPFLSLIALILHSWTMLTDTKPPPFSSPFSPSLVYLHLLYLFPITGTLERHLYYTKLDSWQVVHMYIRWPSYSSSRASIPINKSLFLPFTCVPFTSREPPVGLLSAWSWLISCVFGDFFLILSQLFSFLANILVKLLPTSSLSLSVSSSFLFTLHDNTFTLTAATASLHGLIGIDHCPASTGFHDVSMCGISSCANVCHSFRQLFLCIYAHSAFPPFSFLLPSTCPPLLGSNSLSRISPCFRMSCHCWSHKAWRPTKSGM